MAFGFGVGDLIQVSNLAFKLYRRCRDSSAEFKTLSQEVASLRLVVDDIRVTILEHDVEGEKVDEILIVGQGCLNCLIELEELLRKYESLGSKHKRTWDRLRWNKDAIADVRQRVITNTNFLQSFNLSLTRSATSRIESLLLQFLAQWKQGELEGSIVSRKTIEAIEEGDDDVWRELAKELEDAGITEDQVDEHKKLITKWIKEAILTGNVENHSLASFHTASEGAPSTVITTATLTGDDIPPTFDFPGDAFRLTKDRVQSADQTYIDAPEQLHGLQDRISALSQLMIEIQGDTRDLQSLFYHEKLARKEKMELTLPPLNTSIQEVRDLADRFKSRTPKDEIQWTIEISEMAEVHRSTASLTQQCHDLDSLFRDLGILTLASLEDKLRNILRDTKDGQREQSVLQSWDELEVELADGQDIKVDDVRDHRDAISSFIKISIEDHESSRRDSITFSNSETLGESINSRMHSASSPKVTFQRSEGSVSELGQSKSSFTGSLPSDTPWTGNGLPNKPKRASVLFVDGDNEVRSPMAEAYFSHLKDTHPTLAGHFSRTLSAGMIAARHGNPVPSGVSLLLRDNGIHQNFIHTSRRLEPRDVEKYEYILVMNSRQREDIISRWKGRTECDESDISTNNRSMFREDIEAKVFLLGSFGNEGPREVSLPESINGDFWWQMGTRRIYPGYDKCWGEIKKFVADFILELTGYDVHSYVIQSADEEDSREVSEDDSEDYNSAFMNMSQNPWGYDEERSPFEELSKTISNFQDDGEGLSPSESNPGFPNLEVSIRVEQQNLESDEEVLHKHHEQFERLVNLLSTDIGDSGVSSLKASVLEWEDSNRVLLTVNTGPVRWTLQKSPADVADGCVLCAQNGTRSGLVLDHKLEVISRAEADLLAQFLSLAIQQENQQSTEEQSNRLEQIRDNPVPGPAAPPSIRDTVSVFSRNDRPTLTHTITRIRRIDAERQMVGTKGTSPLPGNQTPDKLRPGNLARTQTGERETSSHPSPPRLPARLASDAIVPQITPQSVTSAPKTQNTGTEKGASKPLAPKKPVSVLFLSSSHLRMISCLALMIGLFLTDIDGAVMAEIYLFSLVEKDNALARRVNDVVSAGVSEWSPEQKYNPKKLERIFKANNLLHCWPQKPERLLVPEDVVEFDYILLLNNANPEAPYIVWAGDNPDEAEEMKDGAKDGEDWRADFKTKILDLSTFSSKEDERGKSFMDPVQPGQGGKFGVKFGKFEEAFSQIKDAVDQFLLKELRFDVDAMQFIKQERRKTKDGIQTPETPPSNGAAAS